MLILFFVSIFSHVKEFKFEYELLIVIYITAKIMMDFNITFFNILNINTKIITNNIKY